MKTLDKLNKQLKALEVKEGELYSVMCVAEEEGDQATLSKYVEKRYEVLDQIEGKEKEIETEEERIKENDLYNKKITNLVEGYKNHKYQ